MSESQLKSISLNSNIPHDRDTVIALLLRDHDDMRTLMSVIQSSGTSIQEAREAFASLAVLVEAHVRAEEKSLLNVIREHPRFHEQALEGVEEHRLHTHVLNKVKRTRTPERQKMQMKVFCEMLDHHLDEEEEDLFPKFREYVASTTQKKMGTVFNAEKTKRLSDFEQGRIVDAHR